MKVKLNRLKRSAYIAVALTLTVLGAASGIVGHLSAAQLTARSIRLSNSTPDANNVIYRVGFTTATTDDIGGIAIDFCSNTPIIGDACNAPTGFDVNEGTLTVNAETNIGAIVVDTGSTSANSLRLTLTPASISSGTAVSFELGDITNAIHNPTAVGSFYARIYTYDTSAGATGHTVATPAGYLDYGGIAMSTATVINITARVMETLSFCVYNATCGDDPSIIIGHVVGTATVISETEFDVAAVNFSISTNANGGAAIRMKGDTLKSGANDINAAGTPAVLFVDGDGVEHFGLRLSTSGTGITATAPYNGAADTFGLVVTGGGANDVTSTFGGQIAALGGPVNNSVSTVTFAASASNTTPAGTYTAAQQLIATGTF